jgi:hypothetical protein
MLENATFRQRVKEFWRWFPTVAAPIAEQLQTGNGLDDLGPDFVDQIRDRVGGLSWVFGPGEGEGRLSLTVTGEGQKAKQLLSHFWWSQAVEVPGWDFYCSRQPSPRDQLARLAIDVGGSSVDADSLMIATEIDDEAEAVNIKAWHDVFASLPDDGRLQILYLLLDEALGEYGTQTKLGDIQIQRDASARPLIELPAFVDKLWSEKGWSDLSPLETYSGYRVEPSEGFDRADTIAGYTCVPRVVLGFLNNRGRLDEDPIENTGAEFLFIQIRGDTESMSDALKFRTEVDEEVARRLSGAGYVIGGATGTANMYIDLVAFDGNRSTAAIEEALLVKQLDGKYEIKPFA